jgi:hypothetical protein
MVRIIENMFVSYRCVRYHITNQKKMRRFSSSHTVMRCFLFYTHTQMILFYSCVAQVNGGSQSFNAVNALRLLARWMRMPCCTNQSSIAKAWQEFDNNGRMKESNFRERVIDVAEEFAKFTAVMAPVKDDLTNRYSERKEKIEKGRLLSQAEKESEKEKTTMIEESRKS